MKKIRLKFFRKAGASSAGFTLIESLVGLAIFAVIALGVYEAFAQSIRLTETSRLMVDSASLATEQFEIIHNMPYADVGIVSGIPRGKLKASQDIVRDGADFLVETTARNIDDPFDGTLGGVPNDTSPADYKLVELVVSVPNNPYFAPLHYTEYIAPKNLENSSTNGALFVKVFNANGQPVEGADVHIENNKISPAIIIDDITDKDGVLEIVDVPPGINAYEITVSKDGYSQDKTYPADDLENPNPVKSHATIVNQQVTQLSFAIDITSSLKVESVTETCVPVSNIDFSLAGTKLIGTEPDVLKFQSNFNTGGTGVYNVSGLEWDTYNLNFSDSVYDLAGANSPIPFTLVPGSTQDVKIIVSPKNPKSLLVTVKEAGISLPLSGATVTISKGTSSQSLVTGRGFLRQTDWSGGAGQANYYDKSKYFISDGNIENSEPEGEIKLKNSFGSYSSSGSLISSAFDTGSASNFYHFIFTPLVQPPEAGTDSVKFQIATNKDDATWDFKGPDGTADTFYSATNANINAAHNGDRYLRYAVYLSTASSTYTPDIGDVSFTFSSLCVPSGQVMFDGLQAGDYSISVEKSGYQTAGASITLSSDWQQKEILLMPQ
jgi:prepilin-type N-terminal cleavage/methylation domain-containing protein